MAKKALLVLMSSMLTFGLAACGSGGEAGSKPAAQQDAAASGSPAKKTKISVITQGLEPKKMLEKFYKENPNIEVNWETIGGGKVSEVIKTRLAAGGDGVDLITPLRPDYLQLAKTGQLVDLSSLPYLDNYNPAVIDSSKVDGKLYALSLSLNFYVTWYNKSIFKENNLNEPKNWEDFLAVCEALKAKGVPPIVVGAKDQGENNHLSGLPFAGLLSKDPTWVQKVGEGKAKWTDPDAIAAFEKFKLLVDKGYLLDGALGIGRDQAYQAFYQGKAAMISQQVGVIEFLALNTPGFEVGAFAPPGNDKGQELRIPFSPGNTLALYNGSKNKEAALKFMEFISKTENAQLMSTETALISSVKGIKLDFHPIAASLNPLLDMKTSDLMHAAVTTQTKPALATALQKIIGKVGTPIPELAKEIQAVTDKEIVK
ncbi:ABC transporter substrate-binding protein [Paenibacillus thalictri]|uniref:Extracellular solute-binding protein n=1 Tax=Paenibacillus thalictri TaxID=2527873 RepID=A0A4Q9DVP8_9BACL|nr:extracellular solute-binding protein [Paenibacillus thalictri]TBL81127.1 extracellular solute-binding protein [Paenibacillus thalictri]